MAYRALYPRQLILVVSRDSRPNVMAASWAMPVSFEPLLISVAVGKSRHTHGLIKKSGEFVIAIPDYSMREKVVVCGSHSGKDVDKFKLAGLTKVRAERVQAPLIKECQVNLECKLVKSVPAGDHTVFVGKVVAVHGERKKPCMMDAGGRRFVGL